MIQQAIEMIGRENIEEIACMVHFPMDGNYVIVAPDHSYKIIDRKRMAFNSKYCGMDFYSKLISMNKPIASKLITSNNYYTFFCKNIEKLKENDIDNYYDALELPEELDWHRDWVKSNIKKLGQATDDIVKIFFPAPEKAIGSKACYTGLEDVLVLQNTAKNLVPLWDIL